MSFLKIIIFFIISSFLVGCGETRSESEDRLGYKTSELKFSSPIITQMGYLFYADKRGFADIDGDGVEDMIAIDDSTGFFEKQDFKAYVYQGYYNSDGILNFKNKTYIVDLPFSVNKYNSWKLDTLNINADQKADLVYTQFVDSYDGDLIMKYAINIGDRVFAPMEKYFNNDNYYNTGIGTIENEIIGFIHDMQNKYYYDEEQGINDYLKQDWCDFDNNGTDDFVMLWKSYKDYNNVGLSILIGKSSIDNQYGYLTFDDYNTYHIPVFMNRRYVHRIDTADYNGDGYCDILSFYEANDHLKISISFFDGNKFIPTKTQIVMIPKGMDFLSEAKKFDTFDRNNDGKADLNLITEQDDKPVLITWFSN